MALDETQHMIPETEENSFYLDDILVEPEDEIELKEEDLKDMDEYTPDAYDEYLGAELVLPHSSKYVWAWVMKRLKDNNGQPIGQWHDNYFLKTRQYEVEFPDSSTEEYHANIIAKNLYAQVDTEGCQYLMLQEISDHKKDEMVIPISEGLITTKSGN